MSIINPNLSHSTQPIVDGVNKILPHIPTAIFVLLIGILLVRILMHLIRFSLSLSKLPKGLADIIASLTHASLWIFLGIAFLQFLGLSNVALAVTGSFAFVVLGISQGGATTVADVIAGLSLARDRDFSVGDLVRAGEKQTEGVIEKMDIRRTRLRDTAGRLHIIPNADIDKNEWTLIAKRKDLQSEDKLSTIK